MERVITYIDGYNLYYGLRSMGTKQFYWLDIKRLARVLLRSKQTLVSAKYFTSIVKRPEDRRRRQAAFIDALLTLSDVNLYYGQFLEETVTCRSCGHTYTTYHEKMTDVNISVELMSDAFKDAFDVALLVSGDSDLVGPIEAVKRFFPAKRVVVAFPPNRFSYHLKRVANGALHIGRNELAKSQLPDQIIKANGVVLRRPAEWR